MRLLIGCGDLVAGGGLLRFERIGKVLRGKGHQAAYAMQGRAMEFQSELPVLGIDEAAAREWDAVLIPGAGFPDEVIKGFARFTGAQFGARVQMVLNDRHLKSRFLKVNTALKPHLVIFNNCHWTPGSYREFHAHRFHYLVGAVDTALFHPQRRRPADRCRFVIGAQLAKNPGPLIAALDFLPQDCTLRFFGFDRSGRLSDGPCDHRIEYTGPLFGEVLADYYGGLDAMVSTEERAGWANVVAEAMASGVPVVTTPAGTLGIATNEDTALVVERPTPQALARGLLRIRNDRAFASAMAARARAHIEHYDWERYTDRLIGLVQDFNAGEHGARAPELGLSD